LKVAAIIEKSKMGEKCLNRSCIPSKLLLHSADVAEMVRKSDQFRIKVEKFSIDFRKIVDRVGSIIDSDSNTIRNAFEEMDNPKLFPVEGKFVAEKTIAVGEGKTIRADRILIASGTRPAIPRIKGLEESGYITSD
jgi:mycothione reductase